MRLAVLLSLSLFLVAVQNVSAASTDALADPAVALPDGVEVRVGDRDGDGHTEASVDVDTPRCGCYCPGVGGGFEAEAAGQELFLDAYTALCQHGVEADVDPANLDPLGPVVVDPFVYFIGPLRDLVEESIRVAA